MPLGAEIGSQDVICDRMNARLVKVCSTIFLSLLVVSVVSAQTLECAAFARQVIEESRQSCSELDVNQACYGSSNIELQPRENVRLDFSETGDIAPLASIVSLSTSHFEAEAEIWGIALAQVRANLLDGAVSLVAFGQTTLENSSEASSDFVALNLTVREPTGANLRENPDPSAAVVRQLYSGDVVQAIGRLSDNSWFRLADGWVSAEVVRSQSDLNLLQVLEPDSQIADVYAPMQIFRLRTGYEDSPCAGAADSGLLLQSPTAASAFFVVNGAPLTLNGTLLLQTTSEGRTVLSLLEGTLSYSDGFTLRPGRQIQYGYQGDVIEYSSDMDYNYARARLLPLVLLPREFELPFTLGGVIFPFTPGTGFLQGIPADGQCTAAWTVDVNLRLGPGTNYPIRRGVSGGYYGLPDARAVGSDGAIWWRLVEGVWVAADNTVTGGSCGTLPLVDPPPLPSS